MDYKLLPPEYSHSGMVFKNIEKSDYAVIYEHQNKNESESIYEVFKRKVMKQVTIQGKLIPAHEKIPGNESFGVWAWCIRDKKQAYLKFQEINDKKNQDDEDEHDE